MRLCRHDQYRVINWIKEPKYSTDEVLIRTDAIYKDVEHYLIKFSQCNQYPDWFYMSGALIRKGKKQKNGRGEVYVVSMASRETFEPIKQCEHQF